MRQPTVIFINTVLLSRIYSLSIGFVLCLSSSLAQVTADFSASQTESCGSVQINFFDQSFSQTSIFSWVWDLGGVISTRQNPGRIFNETGFYTICLTVTDLDGEEATICRENYIKIYDAPVADFSVIPSTGCAPLDVEFIDLSTSANGDIVDWTWDVGGSNNVIQDDGSLTEIVTTYDFPDTYSASLSVVDDKGCTHSVTKTDVIVAQESPVVEAEVRFIDGCQIPATVEFINLNVEPGVDYFWNFGNGAIAIGPNPPIVQYNSAGIFDAYVIGTRGDCKDTLRLNSELVIRPPVAISSSTTQTCRGEVIQFSDDSPVSADSLFWHFGDGETSDDTNPSHAYTTSGCFDVLLIRYFNGCIDSARLDACVQIVDQPRPDIVLGPQVACTMPFQTWVEAAGVSTAGDFTWEIEVADTTQTHVGLRVDLTFDDFGSFPVRLTHQDSGGCTATVAFDTLEIKQFSASLPSLGPMGCAPLTFTLSDSIVSEVPIASYNWQIGRPPFLSSTSPSPQFTIDSIGAFDVTLEVVSNGGCRDTIFGSDYIRTGSRPDVDFEVTPRDTCASSVFSYFDLSSSNANGWFWEFGDGDSSYLQNPTHEYTDTGFFSITLTAFHNGCPSREMKADHVYILGPIAKFSPEYYCDDPYRVTLADRSVDADSIFWIIDIDSLRRDTITLDTFDFVFDDRGIYPIELWAFNYENACEYVRLDTLIITDPVALFTVDTTRGCVPLTINTSDASIDAIRWQYSQPGSIFDNDTLANTAITFEDAGIYTDVELTVIDTHQCASTYRLPDTIFVNQVTANFSVDGVICTPDSAQLTDQSSSLFGHVETFRWQIPAISFTSDVMNPMVWIEDPGTYRVVLTATDDWGCSDRERKNRAFEGVDLRVDFSADTLSCTWKQVRFRDRSVGESISRYFWEFGDGETSDLRNPRHLYRDEGVYTVCLTVEEERGCSKRVCKEQFVRIADPRATFSGSPLSDDCPPLLVDFVNASENALTYTWDFGDQSGKSSVVDPSHVYTAPGAFDVQLIARSVPGCTDTLRFDDYVTLSGPVGSFAMEVDSSCVPLQIELFGESQGAFLYIWDFGEGSIDSSDQNVEADTAFFEYTFTGMFVPRLILVDSFNCTRSLTGDPLHVDDIHAEFTFDVSDLCDGPATVSIQNNTSSTSTMTEFQWSVTGPETFQSQATDPDFQLNEPGIYDISLVASSALCVDSVRVAQAIELETTPVADFEPIANQLCESVEVHFENRTTNIYGEVVAWLWDFGDGDTSTVAQPFHVYDSVRNYTVTLTAETVGGCIHEISKTIEVLSNVSASAGPDQVICIDETAQLDASIFSTIDGQTFFWTDHPSLSCTDCLDPIAAPSDTTLYELVVVHPNGCSIRDSIIVFVAPEPSPTVVLTPDTTICVSGTATIEILNFDLSQYTYVWDPDQAGLDCYENCAVIDANPAENTVYTVTVTNTFGCTTIDDIQVDVETDVPPILDDHRTICLGDSIRLAVQFGSDPVWHADPSLSCLSCSDPVATPDAPATYIVDIQSTFGCPFSDTLFVDVLDDSDVDAGVDSLICRGEQVQLSGLGPGSVVWSPAHVVSDPNILNPTALPDSTTTLVLTITEDLCSLSDSLQLDVIQKLEIAADGDTICPMEAGQLIVTGDAETYQWFDLSRNTLVSEDTLWHTSPEETTLYQVIGSKRICETDTAVAQIFVYPTIDIELETFHRAYSNLLVSMTVEYDESRDYTFLWEPADGLSCGDCPNPTIEEILESTKYTLAVIDNASGCMIDTMVLVRYLDECTEDAYFVPNAFSPNGDGVNDEAVVFAHADNAIDLFQIFDRWGNLLFQTEDISVGWDGTYKGVLLQPAVYVYVVHTTCKATGEPIFFGGDITLFR